MTFEIEKKEAMKASFKQKNMSNKKIIEKYIDGFNKSNHEQILSCLTDDIIWEMAGLFYKVGKQEFDQEIENDFL